MGIIADAARAINDGVDRVGDAAAGAYEYSKNLGENVMRDIGATESSKWSDETAAFGAQGENVSEGGKRDAARHLEWMAMFTQNVAKRLTEMGVPEKLAMVIGARTAQNGGDMHEALSLGVAALKSLGRGASALGNMNVGQSHRGALNEPASQESMQSLRDAGDNTVEAARSSSQDFANNAYGAEVLAHIKDKDKRRGIIADLVNNTKPQGMNSLVSRSPTGPGVVRRQ